MGSAQAVDVPARGEVHVATAAYQPRTYQPSSYQRPTSYQQAVRTINLPPAAPRVFAITPERRALLNTIRYARAPGPTVRTWATGSCSVAACSIRSTAIPTG